MRLKNNGESPLVSVIVPVYNSEKYIAQCVDSLLHQTLKNIEILLIDDGSTDNSPALCDEYARHDKRVKAIHQKNGGYGKACNSGIKLAGSGYFGILESDDYAEPDMFEKLYNLAKTNDLDVARGHFYYYNSQNDTHERVDLSHIPQNSVYAPRDHFSVFNQAPSVWAMIYRKSFITKNKIKFLETPGASYQDTSFAFKVYACADRFMLTDGTFVHYRIDNENSSVASKEKVYCVCDEYGEIERFLHENGIYEKLLPVIPKTQFVTYMWNYRRISGEYRWPFLKMFAMKMRAHIHDKAIENDFYTNKERLKIYIIAFFYPVFHFIPVYNVLTNIF